MVLVCVAIAGLLSSCSGSQDESAASVAERFVQAASQQQGPTACSLLAPGAVKELEESSGRPCDRAVLEEDVGPEGAAVRVQVFDQMAQVRFETDTVFLSRFDGEWLVIAAACVPQPGRPYDCGVQVS